MIKRKIGKSALEVFPIGLGAMGMSEFYGSSDESESIKTHQAAIERGVNFIDTSDMYQGADIFPIPVTTKIKNLIENIEAINITLTQEEITKLKSTMTFISGTRYSEAGMKGINL